MREVPANPSPPVQPRCGMSVRLELVAGPDEPPSPSEPKLLWDRWRGCVLIGPSQPWEFLSGLKVNI